MISTKGRYALRLMIDLAEHQDTAPVPLKEIAERQDISKKYLEIIIKDLVREGLVEGKSGKSGGYRLSRPPEEYRLSEILEAEEGTLVPVACLECGAKECPRRSFCKSLPMWKELNDLLHGYLSGKTLADITFRETE